LELKVYAQKVLSGGSIHQVLRVDTSLGFIFVKWNLASQAEIFRVEAQGLECLRAANCLRIPEVLAQIQTAKHAALVLEFITPGSSAGADSFWLNLGQGLAAQHRHSTSLFGLDHDNYIGSLPQSNTQHADWIAFFVAERLEPMLKLARHKALLGTEDSQSFDRLMHRLDQLLPQEPPALLHGDLWSGNLMTGIQGQPWLVDPAVYYGHREAELAFTRLFGGFAEQFYRAYQQTWPLQDGWQQRVRLFNLYPLLVHLNIFGSSYLSEIQETLKRFS